MRRVRNALGFGTTTAPVVMEDGLPTVQVRLTPLELQSMRVVEMRGFAGNLPVGTPVVAAFQSGDRSGGVVTGSTAPASRPALEGPEDAALYGYGFVIRIAADGIHIKAPKVTIEAAEVSITGDLKVQGEITARQGGASVTLSGHRHANGPAPTPGT